MDFEPKSSAYTSIGFGGRNFVWIYNFSTTNVYPTPSVSTRTASPFYFQALLNAYILILGDTVTVQNGYILIPSHAVTIQNCR